MTGAFEKGEGEYFFISCEDGEDGIFFFVSSKRDPGVF